MGGTSSTERHDVTDISQFEHLQLQHKKNYEVYVHGRLEVLNRENMMRQLTNVVCDQAQPERVTALLQDVLRERVDVAQQSSSRDGARYQAALWACDKLVNALEEYFAAAPREQPVYIHFNRDGERVSFRAEAHGGRQPLAVYKVSQVKFIDEDTLRVLRDDGAEHLVALGRQLSAQNTPVVCFEYQFTRVAHLAWIRLFEDGFLYTLA